MKKTFLALLLCFMFVLVLSVPSLADDSYDPYGGVSSRKWHLNTIEVEEAWSKGFVGSGSVTVAIIDTGVADVSDLENNIDYYNSCSIINGIFDTVVTDVIGHGTFIAGLIGGDLDGAGINGICQNVNIISLKVSDDSTGLWGFSDICDAIDYAVDCGAQIINLSCSFRSTAYSVKFSEHSDVLFVCAAGNNGISASSDSDERGIWNHPSNVIVVGASDSTDAKGSFSNFDANIVELFAPGCDVCSLELDGTMKQGSGTSFSAPMVTGAAALIMSHATHLSAQEVRLLIMDYSEPVSALSSYCASGRRLNLTGIISYLYSDDVHRTAYTKGDVNGDGTITANDYLLCKRHVLGTYTLTGSALGAADVDSSGTVTALDYGLIQRYCYRTFYFPPY